MGVHSAVASRRSLAWLQVALTLVTVAVLSMAMTRWAAAQPAPGEVVMAWHVTIAPTWFDPSTAPPQITPFGMLYALHDALVRAMPGRRWAMSGGVVDGEPGRAGVRVQAAPGAPVPQR